MKRLKAFEGDVISRGIFPDLGIDLAPFWVDGYNALFKGGTARPMYGPFAVHGVIKALPLLDIHSQIMDGIPTIFEGYTDSIYSWQKAAGSKLEYTLTPVIATVVPDGTIARTWDISSWGNFTVATNGVGSLLLKKGTAASFLPITSTRSPINGKILVRRSPYLLVGNSSLSPTTVMWCTADDIETWNPLPANSAGSYPIRDISDLTCGLEFMGETVWLAQNSLTTGVWVGMPNVFSFKTQLTDIGAVGPKAACQVGMKLYGIGERGIWTSDLYNYEYDDTPIMRSFLRERLNVPQRSQITVVFDAANRIVLFNFPEVGQDLPSAAVTWDLDGKQWGRLTYGRTAFDQGDVFDYALTGDSSGQVWGQKQEAEAVAGLVSNQFVLVESCSLLAGYGEAGYGELGYGGNYPLDGKPSL